MLQPITASAPKSPLEYTVVAAAVSAGTTLVALFLKDVGAARSFERWKQRQARQATYDKYREPLRFAAVELCSRMRDIHREYPPDWLHPEVLADRSSSMRANTSADPYYMRYRLQSTTYRLCAFLAWLELYRQDIVYLSSGVRRRDSALEALVKVIRSDLADGHLNEAEDWTTWADKVIFREELRAIGEAMLEIRGPTLHVMGYARFDALFNAENTAAPERRWLMLATAYFVDPTSKDFRRERASRLVLHLLELIELLQESPLGEEHVRWRRAMLNEDRSVAGR